MNGPDLWGTDPPEFVRIIGANGDSYLKPRRESGKAPWIPHDDPDLLRWMGVHGYSCIEEIPAYEDHRGPQRCERCGVRGVELHHTAPREWFGDEECEEWPTAWLCRRCHARWHQVANRAAVKVTIRQLKGRGLHRAAARLEEMLEVQEDSDDAA